MTDINSEKRIAIRKYHNQLKVTSNGVIILGLWSILKTFLMMVSDYDVEGLEDFERTTFNVVALCIIFAIVLAIDFRFRLVIWRGARVEAYGRKKNNRYLVLAFFLILVSAFSMVSIVVGFINGDEKDFSLTLTSLIVETTSFVILCELVYSGIKMRRIRAEIAESEGIKSEEVN